MDPAARAYRDTLERLDRWFADAVEQHPGVIPCRSGCSACCHGPFDVSAADTLLIREALAELPPAAREEVRAAAQRLLARIREQAPQWQAPWDLADLGDARFDGIAESLADVPCPLLDAEGRCRIYASRPLVCRLIGLPMMTAEGELLENACPIQEQFPDYALLDPQLFDLGALQEAEDRHNEAAAERLFGDKGRAGFETTIAAIAAHS
ncbi:MAG TPA: YkgJ family cysteine cluster protein [Gemmatimonadales bacterium]|nr:YkgJ family cysteine cluster protein [Gemmatimonadales bacterium]